MNTRSVRSVHSIITHNPYCAGSIRATRPLHEHHVEHLPDDEAGHTHVDPFQHLAVHRAVHIRHVQHVAQRRGTQADHGVQEEAGQHRQSYFYHKAIMTRVQRPRWRWRRRRRDQHIPIQI